MIAVLSDIHANEEALRTVLRDAEAHGAGRYLCLGDMIGFNGNPAECLALLLPRLDAAVRGNHEEELQHPGLFGVPLYCDMMKRTEALLQEGQKEALRDLPLRLHFESAEACHAQFCGKAWGRIGNTAQAAANFAATAAPLLFFGHSHRASLFRSCGGQTEMLPPAYENNAAGEGSAVLTMKSGSRYLVNPGSVGQPRDGDWRAAYALWDPAESRILLRRLPYDVRAAAAKISRTGLPASFAQALLCGSSPTGD